MSGHSEHVNKQATQANTNPEALSHQMPTGGSGEFHARQGQDAPQTTHGHKPGVNVGNEAVPEAHIQTMPPGSAPANATYTPNSSDPVPQQGGAADMPGATSASVDAGMGKPMQGQTSSELRHDEGPGHHSSA
ncbi:hypothetical protein KC316_g9838 [Hortaea werneckii]|nr:hypothetical protein KC324_g2666 [Hortaea werneckii]KAI7230138.1 hypothetical protein KC330_g7112 [Hortaea werneckii]KAI7578520.1 hypothetical protein KC316_g9838 [Hortaea werneckii]